MTDQPQYPSYPGPEQPETSPPSPTPPAPPPGYQPPPPGYQPPPVYGQAAPAGYVPPGVGQPPAGTLAGWWSRVGAYLLDGVIATVFALPFIVAGAVILGVTGTETTNFDGTTSITGENPLGYVMIGIGYLALLGFTIWNNVFRQGRTGQSLGKKIVGIKVVVEGTGQPTGAALAFGRVLLLGILSTFTCYLNLLWPLWDAKNQALHDKVVSTLVVPAA